jgi:HEAT repeat protein
MQFIQPTKLLALLLAVLLSIPQPLLAQVTPAVRRPAQSKKPPVKSDLIATAISDLLKETPLKPGDEDDADDSTNTDSDDEKVKPPADDGPIGELVAFWSRYGYAEFDESAPKPSDKVRQRLLDHLENRPWLASSLSELLPETPDTYDRLYKLLFEEADAQDRYGWQGIVRQKLMFNSSYFRDELIEVARLLSKQSYVDKSALQALARLDWDAAKPLIEDLLKNPVSTQSVKAQAMLYEQAAKTNDSSTAESLRSQLMAVVANPTMGSERHDAFTALMESEWSGRDEWFVSLFADPTLSGVRVEEKIAAEKTKTETKSPMAKALEPRFEDQERDSNILWIPLTTAADKLVPIVAGLIGNGNRVIHLAGVSTLAAFLTNPSGKEEVRKQAARALLPWLSEPDWGGKFERWAYLESLSKMNLPESVPGLIWMLDNDSDTESLALVAVALVKYKNPQAIPALRRALNRGSNEFSRESIIVALAKLGGFPDAEAAAAIEAYARRTLTEDGEAELREAREGSSEKPLPLQISIGLVLSENEDVDISDGLATMLFNRAKVLKRTQPDLARKLVSIAQQSDGIVADLNLIEQIAEGWVNVEALKLALDGRAQLRKRAAGNVEELFKQGGYQTGLAAVILNEENKLNSVLAGSDALAQQALLVAARYTRQKLPVESVGKLLANASLVAVAESYLEVEDSAEARKLIWSRHPGEARILGEGREWGINEEAFYAPPPTGAAKKDGPPTLGKWEEKMRQEVLRANGPTEIYAVTPSINTGVTNSIIVRVGQSGAEISLHQAEGRRLYRTLDSSELQELKELTSREEVENLGPEAPLRQVQFVHDRRLVFEYLRLTKDGGRRIMLSQLRRAPKKDATLHEQLSGLFYRLSKTGEFKLRYTMEDLIPGVEVLVAEDKRPVISICQEVGQLRVMVAAERPASPNLPGPTYSDVVLNAPLYEWRTLVSGQLGAPVDETPNCLSGNMLLNLPEWMRELRMKVGVMPDRRSRFGDVWFAQSNIEDEFGIWKFEEGKQSVKIADGYFSNLVVTPDGKWLVAQKTIESQDKYETRVVRIDLQTKRELPVVAAQATNLIPMSFIAAHNKVLLSQQEFQYREDSKGNFLLLDAETGATQPIKGEFRPLKNPFARPLQPTDKPNEFWAALYDGKKKATTIGRYDTRSVHVFARHRTAGASPEQSGYLGRRGGRETVFRLSWTLAARAADNSEVNRLICGKVVSLRKNVLLTKEFCDGQ